MYNYEQSLKGVSHMTDPRAMAFVNLYGVLATLENLCALDATAKNILKKLTTPVSLCFDVKDGPCGTLHFDQDGCIFTEGSDGCTCKMNFMSPKAFNDLIEKSKPGIPTKNPVQVLSFLLGPFTALTNRLTEHKYRGSYIQLAEVIRKHSSAPLLDVQRFWEIVIFSWITGNSDMHCKNFSLIETPDNGYILAPAYDPLAVLLTGIDDKDELAMPLMGYGADDDTAIGEFDKSDFLEAMAQSGISANVSKNILNKFHRYKPKWFSLIDSSFLSENIKGIYKALIEERLEKIVG